MRDVIKVIKADYVDKFKCLKTSCKETCCAGWDNISIDYETYVKYFQKADFKIKDMVKKKVNIDKPVNSEIFYADFILNKDKSCPFLTARKLCLMQLEMGESYLPFICSIYPRAYNIVNGVMEEALVLSCPEAARLILLNPKGIGFKVVEEENYDPRIIKYAFNIDEAAIENAGRYFTELRKFAVKIIKDRRYSIEDRIIMLGFFMEDTERIRSKIKYSDVSEVIDLYIKKLDNGAIPGEVPIQAGDVTFKLKILIPILLNKLNSGISNKRFSECLNEFLRGIEYNDNNSENRMIVAYLKGYNHYYQPFMKKHEYIFENYFVNFIFKNLFPLDFGGKLYEKYIILALNYSIIKMLLTGIAEYNKTLTKESVVKLIQSYTKTMEYDYESFRISLDYLIKNGRHDMGYLQVFVKG